MPTTWFFDGGGTSVDCAIMVLSGVGGSDAAVDALGQAWKAALHELQIDTWHSTDYFRRRDRGTKPEFPVALANVIGRLIFKELNCVSFAADKAALEAVRIQHPESVPSVERMLMNLCFRGLGVSKEDIGQHARVRIVFDRGEPFIRHLKSSWQAGRTELKRAKHGGWPLQVKEMEPANSKDHAGLQVGRPTVLAHPMPL